MDKIVAIEDDGKVESPENFASYLSLLFFSWLNPMFKFAKKKRKRGGNELDEHDLWEVPERDKTSVTSAIFENRWINDEHKSQKKLKNSIWSVIGRKMWFAAFFKFLNSTLQFSYPIIMNQILTYIQDQNLDTFDPLFNGIGYFWAVAFGLAMALKALMESQYFYLSFRSGWQTRSTLSTQVFKKSLRLSAASKQSMTTGQIVNVMQLDTSKIELFISTGFHVLWDGIYQIAGYMGILYYYIGWPAFVGLGVMLIAIPIQGVVFGRIFKINRKVVKVTDSRVKLTNEVLQGILSIKMSAAENNYAKLINEYRKQEISLLKSQMYLVAFSASYMMAMPAITAVIALSVFAVNQNGSIDAATLFTALNAFNSLRFPLMFYPQALTLLVQAKVSLKRVADFLSLDEVKTSNDRSDEKLKNVAVKVENGEFYWKNVDDEHQDDDVILKVKSNEVQDIEQQPNNDGINDKNQPALVDINIEIPKKTITAIVGAVGSYKSTLLSSFLGELHQTNGRVVVNGSIGFAAQSAWIMNATVRDNILYGEPFDERRYRKVLKACQLQTDLDVLQDGDQTMIGERGINISGGQKQRISTARVAYSKKEIAILDDPLSALDPEVANRLFNQCIRGLMKDRTVILVTNQLQFLPKCHQVIVMDQGEPGKPGYILEQGKYQKLIKNGLNFSKLIEKFNGVEKENNNIEEKRISLTSLKNNDGEDDTTTDDEEDEDDTRSAYSRIESSQFSSHVILENDAGNDLMQVEERQKGAVSFSEYLGYIRAGGGFFFFGFILFLFVVSQLGTIGNTAWVTIWSNDTDYENFSLEFYLVGYAISAVLVAILTYMRSIGLFYMGLVASRKLHQNVLKSILQGPMSFFDTTPIGRIVSRFSKDLFAIDTMLPQQFSFFLFTSMFVLFSIATIGFTTPWFLVSLPVLIALYLSFLQYYRPVARDAKRLESISRSPIYSHFSETLGGLSTIRAFGFIDKFKTENAAKVDENIKSWYLLKSIERWLSVRLELLGSCIAILAAVLAVYMAENSNLSSGEAGLSLTFAISVTSLLNQTVRTFADLEGGMNSVERVLHYSNNIEQEKPFVSNKKSGLAPPKSWPENGNIILKDVSMRYRRDTPLVLKDINLEIQGGNRVGIVGRSGSGKSSALQVLLRLSEPEEGSIMEIDGVDILEIGLHELRTQISIVPQNPVIFSGSVRSNLDPFSKYSDEEIWKNLELCSMKTTIEELGGLDGEVSEYGENFSQGQRQLLALCKSTLAKTKILLLDEATSSIDYETQETIQSTISNAFENSTIITIAHRLQTVVKYDQIVVLDEGRVVEQGTPKKLLSNPESQFSSMVNELGPQVASKIRKSLRIN